MNELLVNSYHSSCQVRKNNNERMKNLKKDHYHTWPRKKKSAKKCKIAQIINEIKSKRSTSLIELKLNSSNKVHQSWNYDACTNSGDRCMHMMNNRQRTNFSKQYDEIRRKLNNKPERNDSFDSQKISKSFSTDILDKSGFHNGYLVEYNNNDSIDKIIDGNKFGILRLLKDWKLDKNGREKEYGKNDHASFNYTRSSVSSINTLNESDSTSFTDFIFTFSKSSKSTEYENKIMSSSHLIQLQRPETLPPKPVDEQLKHQKEYERMVDAVKRKECVKDMMLKKNHENRLKLEERLSQVTYVWLNELLPNWNQMKNSRKAKNLWWNGLPPCVRGKVWSLSIGNKLNITSAQYFECVRKSKEILKNGSSNLLQINESYEHSVELIRLDISRTFPNLCIFQHGGPYYDVLHNLLGAYVCYQPDIGYVQGMSFIAAVLLLNMEEVDAFICFTNMLNQPCHKAFYSLDVRKMRTYYLTYTDLLRVNMYDLYKHVSETSLSPDLYLVDWVYTLFSKSMSLDLTCRIWDLIVRDGETFIFRAALGIMHLSKNELLKMDFIRSAQYLTKLPDDLCPDKLFKSIARIRMNNGSFTFEDLLLQYSE